MKTIAEKFSTFLADIDPKSASKNHQLIDQYLQYINNASSLLKNLTINEAEFKTAFFALKTNELWS